MTDSIQVTNKRKANQAGPEVINFFYVLNSSEHEIFSGDNMKMPTIVGIFIFISRGIFVLCYV